MDLNPICHLPPGIKWNAYFYITFNLWWSAGLVNGLKPHLPPLFSQKNEMLIFGLCSTSDDRLGWSLDSNPIRHPLQPKKWNACFGYVQLLMISQAGRRTPTPSVTPLQPKKWNACFCIMVNFWWSAGLVDELESHLPPLSSQKNEMLVFGLHSTSDDWPGWSMDSNPICHPSPNKKWYAHFCITFKFWWLAGLVNGLKPHLQPLSRQKSEMLIFGLRSTCDDWPGWSMDSNPICHLSPGIKWNAHFCIMFNLWWSARLVNGLKPHLPPLSSQKNEMLIFGLCWTSDSWLGWPMDSNPIHDLSPAKEWNACFWIYI